MNNNTMLEAALACVRRGMYVFPCMPRSKAPATSNGFKDATTAEEKIRRWWTENAEYNIGVPTGELNGFWVLDVDGNEGKQSLQQFVGKIPPDTPQVKTGSGGLHLYFAWSENLGLHNRVGDKYGPLPGLDVRTNGGYVVAHPSIHESGESYEWVGESREPTEAPENLVDALRRRTEGLVAFVEATIDEGSRNATLFSRARSLFRQGYNETEVFCCVWMVNENRCTKMLGKDEVAQIVRSAAKYERGELKVSHKPRGEKKMSEVTPEKVDWLWYGRMAKGKISIIDGDPGLGKSVMTMDLAARVSTGKLFPDGDDVGLVDDVDVGSVILMNAEDGEADTIRPRLDAAGADVDRVVMLTEKEDGTLPTIPEDLDMIEESIARNGAKLLIIDPLMAYLSPKVNSNNDQQVRQALTPLKRMAERLDVAVIVVRHLKKEETTKAVYSGGGSIGIIGAARTGFAVAVDPTDKERVVFAMTKTNIGEKAPSLTYKVTTADNGAARVVWGESVDLDVNDLLCSNRANREPGEMEKAVDWLRSVLLHGPMPSKEFLEAAKEQGINNKTLERAKRAEGVQSKKESKCWVTYLPNTDKADNIDKADNTDRELELVS